MTDGRGWQRLALIVGVGILGVLAPGAALAKGKLKGTFGDEVFKARKVLVTCAYTRSIEFFTIAGAQVKRGRQRAVGIAGTGPDPTSPGATFPVVLTDGSVSFGSGPIKNPSDFATWSGLDDAVTITLTGYKTGKIIGTMTGTLQPILGPATGAIPASVTFAVKCLVL
jgi:hypothetical protein